MNALSVYAIFVLFMVAFSLLVAYNFVRYRFKGDLTLFYIGLYATVFVMTIIITLSLLQPVGSEFVS